MRIIERSERIERQEFHLCFDRLDCPGHGWSFPCDERGNVDVALLPELAQESYRECQAGGPNLSAGKVRVSRWSFIRPAVGECECGRHVELHGFTNTCACGLDYNQSGQVLAPRSQWGEETGESLCDILSIP